MCLEFRVCKIHIRMLRMGIQLCQLCNCIWARTDAEMMVKHLLHAPCLLPKDCHGLLLSFRGPITKLCRTCCFASLKLRTRTYRKSSYGGQGSYGGLDNTRDHPEICANTPSEFKWKYILWPQTLLCGPISTY